MLIQDLHSSNSENKSLEIVVVNQFEVNAVAATTPQEVLFMTTLNAPTFEDDGKSNVRKPIDIVCVIDKSGSMAGSKLDLVKDTLEFVVEQLKPSDRISIVTFDTDVKVDLGLIELTNNNKNMIRTVIKSIQAGSSTNLSGGLFKGLETLSERSLKNEVASVLLFTDGLANYGLTKADAIVNGMNSIINNNVKATVSVHTFGFGTDHDATMLRQISEAASGMYYYIQKVQEIPEAFASCLGGLLSVVAQNISITFEALGNTTITSLLSNQYKHTQTKPQKAFELTLGDIYSEEKKNLLLKLQVQATAATTSDPTIKITLSYFNILNSSLRKFEYYAELQRPEILTEKPSPNYELDKQRNRLISTEALDAGRKLGDAGNLEQARKVLQDAITRIQQSASATDSFSQALVLDLQNVLSTMRDREEFRSVGTKLANNYWQANYSERATHVASAAQTSYENRSKKAYKASAQEFLSRK